MSRFLFFIFFSLLNFFFLPYLAMVHYIEKKALEGLKEYRYSCDDKSILTKYART